MPSVEVCHDSVPNPNLIIATHVIQEHLAISVGEMVMTVTVSRTEPFRENNTGIEKIAFVENVDWSRRGW